MENINEEFTSIRNHKGRRNNPLPHRHRMGIDVMLQTQELLKSSSSKKEKPKYDCFDERERMMYNVFKDIPEAWQIMDLKTLPLLFWTTLETWF
jgi:hypothetical protein